MSKIQKKFDLTISRRFPDGSIGSIAYGTQIEEEVSKVNSEIEAEMFKKVYKSTISDIKKSAKIDPLVQSIWSQIKQQLENESLVANAERKDSNKKEKNRSIK